MPVKFLLVASLLSASLLPTARAESWPRIMPIMDHGRPQALGVECHDALALARAAFVGSDTTPDVTSLSGIQSALVLKPDDAETTDNVADTSSGVGLPPRSSLNDRSEIDFATVDGSPQIFLYKKPIGGQRLAVFTYWFHSDLVYETYLVPLELDAATLLERMHSDTAQSQQGTTKIAENYLPPRIFLEPVSGKPWLLEREFDVAFYGDNLSPWRVLTFRPDGFKPRCKIEFHPPKKYPHNLLPAEVRRLYTALDTTMGSGRNDPSLQPTARLRQNASVAWNNIAVRPWINASPHNSRDIVDRELALWGKRSPANQRTLALIRKQLILAEAALADYYRHSFGLEASVAKRLAAHQIDLGFRSHYVFSVPDGTPCVEPAANPWPVAKNKSRTDPTGRQTN